MLKLTPFKYIAKICNGQDKKLVESTYGEYPIYGSGGAFSKANEYLYSGESVLLGRKGTIDNPLYVSGKFWTVDTMYYTEVNTKLVVPKFLYYLCTTIDFNLYKSGSVLPSMTKEAYDKIKFPLPDLASQKNVCKFLDKQWEKLEILINEKKKHLDLLSEYRQSLITQAVTKGLDRGVAMKATTSDIVSNIPNHWETMKLQYLCSITTGNQDTQDAVDGGMYPFYVRSPIVERTNRVTYKGEGILIAGDGVGAGKVFHYANGEYGIHQRVYLLYNFSKKVYSGFLFQYLKSMFSVEVDKGTAQSTVPSIRMPMLKGFMVCLPPLDEQRKICKFCELIDKEIESLECSTNKAIELLNEYRSSLISAAVTGKIDINEVK